MADAYEWCKKFQRTNSEKDLTQAWDLYYHVFRRISKQLPQVKYIYLHVSLRTILWIGRKSYGFLKVLCFKGVSCLHDEALKVYETKYIIKHPVKLCMLTCAVKMAKQATSSEALVSVGRMNVGCPKKFPSHGMV